MLDCDHIEEHTGTGSSPLTAAPPLPPLADDGVDRPGSDISFADLTAADPNLCEQSCDANGACRAWTYTKPGVKGPAARCYLKGNVPAAVPDPCCVSGIRPPPGAAVGEDMPGSDISFFDLATDDPNLCSAACLGNGACQAWTFTHPGVKGPAARCYLKNPRPPIVADPCCVSGVTEHIRVSAAENRLTQPRLSWGAAGLSAAVGIDDPTPITTPTSQGVGISKAIDGPCVGTPGGDYTCPYSVTLTNTDATTPFTGPIVVTDQSSFAGSRIAVADPGWVCVSPGLTALECSVPSSSIASGQSTVLHVTLTVTHADIVAHAGRRRGSVQRAQ